MQRKYIGLEKIRRELLVVVGMPVAILAGCAIYWFSDWIRINEHEQIYEEMYVSEDVMVSGTVQSDTNEGVEESVYDFDKLRLENPDIYAWIVVPGTKVNYPVLQNEADNYYLERNVDGTTGYPGALYTNKCNSLDFSDYNTVIYGHNMKNGSMFGSLDEFEDKGFFDANEKIIIYTEEKCMVYEIYAVVKFNDQYIPAFFDVNTQDGTANFLMALEEYLDEAGCYKREIISDTQETRLITLSTCVKNEDNRRYLVVGKLTEETYYEKNMPNVQADEIRE